MSFWIYENFGSKRARIHLSDCRYCNNGEGVGGNTENDDDKWHGPFADFNAAESAAHKLAQKDTRPCGVCKPATADVSAASVQISTAPASAVAPTPTKAQSAPAPAARKSAPKETYKMSNSANANSERSGN